MPKRRRTGSVWRKNSAIVRANTERCWRCGKPLDPEARWPSPLFITIGHLLAIEDGGTDELDNLRGECTKCNCGDGANRTNAKRAGTSSKVWRNPNW